MVNVGEMAPDFTLEATTGTVTLSSFRGKNHVVLIFYPRDNTPGCNRQLSAARDAAEEYSRRNVQVLAVNPGSMASHQRWSDKFGFNFPVAVDAGKHVAQAYGALKENGGIQRTVVVIDKEGKVVWVKQGLPATEEILAVLDDLPSV